MEVVVLSGWYQDAKQTESYVTAQVSYRPFTTSHLHSLLGLLFFQQHPQCPITAQAPQPDNIPVNEQGEVVSLGLSASRGRLFAPLLTSRLKMPPTIIFIRHAEAEHSKSPLLSQSIPSLGSFESQCSAKFGNSLEQLLTIPSPDVTNKSPDSPPPFPANSSTRLHNPRSCID